MYEIMWGSSSTTGNLAAPSANPYLGRDEVAASDDDLDSQEDLTMDTGPREAAGTSCSSAEQEEQGQSEN